MRSKKTRKLYAEYKESFKDDLVRDLKDSVRYIQKYIKEEIHYLTLCTHECGSSLVHVTVEFNYDDFFHEVDVSFFDEDKSGFSLLDEMIVGESQEDYEIENAIQDIISDRFYRKNETFSNKKRLIL